MTFEFVVLLIAAAQAFLLAVLTFHKHRSLYANRFLSLLMAVYGIVVLHLLLQDAGVYESYPSLLFVVVGFPYLAAPLHYLYVKFLLSRQDFFPGKSVWHLVPACVTEIIFAGGALFGLVRLDRAATNDPLQAPTFFRYYNWGLVISIASYLIASLALLSRYERSVKKIASSVENVRLSWLTALTVTALGTWIIFFIEYALLTIGINISNLVVSSVAAGVYVYAIGYAGLLKSEVFASPGVSSVMHEIYEASKAGTVPTEKYSRSGLDGATATRIMRDLVQLMDERKPYRDPSLTLPQLAMLLSITPHNLSEVINTQRHQNFYDFVNGYRVDEVRKHLVDPTKGHLKVLAIALEAGFNSKTVFNRIFKESTGFTPSAYRKDAGLSQSPSIRPLP